MYTIARIPKGDKETQIKLNTPKCTKNLKQVNSIFKASTIPTFFLDKTVMTKFLENQKKMLSKLSCLEKLQNKVNKWEEQKSTLIKYSE